MAAKQWTHSELAFVQKNYKNLTDREMADSLGRTISSVNWKRDQMGLKKKVASPSPDATYQTQGDPFIPEYVSFWTQILNKIRSRFGK